MLLIWITVVEIIIVILKTSIHEIPQNYLKSFTLDISQQSLNPHIPSLLSNWGLANGLILQGSLVHPGRICFQQGYQL